MRNPLTIVLLLTVIALSFLSYHFYSVNRKSEANSLNAKSEERISDANFLNEKSKERIVLMPVDTRIAFLQIEAYRKKDAFDSLKKGRKTNLIYHNSKTFRSYALDSFPTFVCNHPLPDNFEWGIGFYPAIKDSNRINIYVIPTLTFKTKIIDFFNIKSGTNGFRDYIKYYNTAKKDINGNTIYATDSEIIDNYFIQDIGEDHP